VTVTGASVAAGTAIFNGPVGSLSANGGTTTLNNTALLTSVSVAGGTVTLPAGLSSPLSGGLTVTGGIVNLPTAGLTTPSAYLTGGAVSAATTNPLSVTTQLTTATGQFNWAPTVSGTPSPSAGPTSPTIPPPAS